eukprot:m.34077 g.34077  ORF g.34077 m.34077 type:complete len:782 (+) comp5099_c0_seq2:141-2486(+)
MADNDASLPTLTSLLADVAWLRRDGLRTAGGSMGAAADAHASPPPATASPDAAMHGGVGDAGREAVGDLDPSELTRRLAALANEVEVKTRQVMTARQNSHAALVAASCAVQHARDAERVLQSAMIELRHTEHTRAMYLHAAAIMTGCHDPLHATATSQSRAKKRRRKRNKTIRATSKEGQCVDRKDVDVGTAMGTPSATSTLHMQDNGGEDNRCMPLAGAAVTLAGAHDHHREDAARIPCEPAHPATTATASSDARTQGETSDMTVTDESSLEDSLRNGDLVRSLPNRASICNTSAHGEHGTSQAGTHSVNDKANDRLNVGTPWPRVGSDTHAVHSPPSTHGDDTDPAVCNAMTTLRQMLTEDGATQSSAAESATDDPGTHGTSPPRPNATPMVAAPARSTTPASSPLPGRRVDHSRTHASQLRDDTTFDALLFEAIHSYRAPDTTNTTACNVDGARAAGLQALEELGRDAVFREDSLLPVALSALRMDGKRALRLGLDIYLKQLTWSQLWELAQDAASREAAAYLAAKKLRAHNYLNECCEAEALVADYQLLRRRVERWLRNANAVGSATVAAVTSQATDKVVQHVTSLSSSTVASITSLAMSTASTNLAAAHASQVLTNAIRGTAAAHQPTSQRRGTEVAVVPQLTTPTLPGVAAVHGSSDEGPALPRHRKSGRGRVLMHGIAQLKALPQREREGRRGAALMHDLGCSYVDTPAKNVAQQLLIKALAIRSKEFGVLHPDTCLTRDALASLYRSQGRFNKVKPLYKSLPKGGRKSKVTAL